MKCFFVFYLPAKKKFLCAIAENAREAWRALKDKMGWTHLWITEKDCKLIVHLEILQKNNP